MSTDVCPARTRHGSATGNGLAKHDASHAIEVQAARFEAILATARDAIISINGDGDITLFNAAAEGIFGFGRDEVLGRNVSILMPSPYREEHDGYIRSYQRTRQARAIGQIRKVEGLRKNGERFPMELSVSEVRVEDEVLYTAVIRDVAERRRNQKELDRLRTLSVQRQRLADIGALTAKIVHDLANPLAALSMVSQGILRRIERSAEAPIETVRSQAERLVATAQRLDALLGEFKDFARGQRLELQDVDIGGLLRAVEQFWKPEAARLGVELVVDVPAEPLSLRADSEKLHRVFDNLVRNALDALDGVDGVDGGAARIEVAVEPMPAARIRIRFSDSGPGLPEGIDVFALFETTKATGTGLGLPICRQILAAHGGEISVAPRAGSAGGGATFHIDLPVHGPPLA